MKARLVLHSYCEVRLRVSIEIMNIYFGIQIKYIFYKETTNDVKSYQ
jgi:hypothetical protein